MDDLETALRTTVLQVPEIVAVINNKFVWNKIPDGISAPVVRARTINDIPINTQSSGGLGKALVQLDIFHTDKVECNQLALLFKSTFNRYRGAIGNFSCRIFVKDAPSDWHQDIRTFAVTLEMDIGYVI